MRSFEEISLPGLYDLRPTCSENFLWHLIIVETTSVAVRVVSVAWEVVGVRVVPTTQILGQTRKGSYEIKNHH